MLTWVLIAVCLLLGCALCFCFNSIFHWENFWVPQTKQNKKHQTIQYIPYKLKLWFLSTEFYFIWLFGWLFRVFMYPWTHSPPALTSTGLGFQVHSTTTDPSVEILNMFSINRWLSDSSVNHFNFFYSKHWILTILLN